MIKSKYHFEKLSGKECANETVIQYGENDHEEQR